MRRLRMHDSAFKAKVAFEAAKGDKTIAEIAAIYEVHPNQVSAWKKEFLERLPEIFNDTSAKEKKDNKIKEEEYLKQIGQLSVEVEWLKKVQATWDKMGLYYKRSMIDREHSVITIGKQCELLGISRSSCYDRSKPEIFNTDQGAQFTDSDFTGILEEAGVTISMDGKGRALDNIYCERLWRTVKYEEIFLKSYDSVPHLRNELDKYFRFYDYKRGHSAHGYKTPWEVYSANSKFWKTGATA